MVESTASKCGSKIRRIVDKSSASAAPVDGGDACATTTATASADVPLVSVKAAPTAIARAVPATAAARAAPPKAAAAVTSAPPKRGNDEQLVEKRRSGEHSTALLLTRRRRHKTVHFTESPVNEFGCKSRSKSGCRYDGRGSVVSLPDEFDNHVQQLFTFIGSVLSSRDYSDHEEERIACKTTTTSSTSVSISVNRSSTTTISRNAPSANPARMKKRQRDVLHFLLYSNQSKFNVDENIGCHVYKHRHWKMGSGTCNALFLKKVGIGEFAFLLVWH